MIRQFLVFLERNAIEYKVTNGYEFIVQGLKGDSDYDVLFKKSDFIKIDAFIHSFCLAYDYKVVQIYHQGVWFKNFFIYDMKTNELLNLDLFGELSRHQIRILTEVEVFNAKTEFHGISILAPYQEFIQYFIKKIDKEVLPETVFDHLRRLYSIQEERCKLKLKQFFHTTHQEIAQDFRDNDFRSLSNSIETLRNDFFASEKTVITPSITNGMRLLKRVFKPTGLTIAFLGPDGAGKSTIIAGLLKQSLPFRRHDYFHLKPLVQKTSDTSRMVTNPHEYHTYSPLKSYIKLLYFFFQYNLGWLKNITPLKIRSSLIIFDRYYDDLFVDHMRYRYGGNTKFAKLMRKLLPRPELYFVLTTDAALIHQRKQEVPFKELERQINGYQSLVDDGRYINIEVNRRPEQIVLEVTQIIMQKMNERY